MVYFMRKETKPEDPKEPENKGISCGTSYCSGEETCIEIVQVDVVIHFQKIMTINHLYFLYYLYYFLQ